MKKVFLGLSGLLTFVCVMIVQNANADCADCFNGKKSVNAITGLHTCTKSGNECMRQ
jgi:hypothetical protein